MYNYIKQSKKLREKRALRVRKKLKGDAQKPRLSVYRSNKHLFAQLIDDENGLTMASYGTLSKEEKGSDNCKKSKSAAQAIGRKIAELAKQKNIEKVVFDRGHNKYHGLLAELADAAREAGLKF
ncbi:MAG: 50S ribosomal protein L18 [Simkaniaceae bacterium]|nr:50S ribosomal protein L18 [Simkaniaceae bacterium]MCF7851879.1 50S ribosomal protein L18 [Simkaniaceae bacterium]